MIELGQRIYPNGWIACVAVWMLDLLPESVRREVLDSYWSPAAIADIDRKAKELSDLFGDQS